MLVDKMRVADDDPSATVEERIELAKQRIEELQRRKERIAAVMDEAIDEEQARLSEIKKTCDHKHPDGSSAWEGFHMFSQCSICGLDDL